MKKRVYKIIACHVLLLALICAYAFLIGCPVYRLAKINCPFCGMTRAHLAFLRGDFQLAMEYHSLFYLGIPFLAGLAHLRVLKKHRVVFYCVLIFIVAAFIAFLVRYIFILTGNN